MAKLYPPTISGIIPAFTGGTIRVPFSMNRAVSQSEVGGFSLKIKTITNDQIEVTSTDNLSGILTEGAVYFPIDLSTGKYNSGNFYKVQLAYKDTNGVIGHYSTVGVAKYTQTPVISILGLSKTSINAHVYDYTLLYATSDETEKLYNYRWIFRDNDGNILQDSGVKLHNVTSDTSLKQATEIFSINRDLEPNKIYTLQCYITTNNGIELHTVKYKLQQKRSIDSEIEVDFKAELDYDNGITHLFFAKSATPTISGTFLLSRLNTEDNIWIPIKRFDLHNILYTAWGFNDYTIEQGKNYIYSLQQYNENGIYSERITTNTLYADFDSIFLFDGVRQLCVRYNPKVATYKRNIQESKTDTIGSKYPFFTRNGNVNYKEFALSGLISYQMDPNNLYLNVNPTLDYTEFPTDLVSANINAERRFKNDVLDWLNDGKVKLLRTATEGNYLVRIMNVSMSPIDTLGRMLHNFSCSAYEIDAVTEEAMTKFGIIDATEDLALQTRWVSVELNTLQPGRRQISNRTATSVNIVDMIPGTKVYFYFASGDVEEVVIGVTGAFKFEGAEIISIEADITANMPGIITYSYNTKQISSFGEIQDVKHFEILCKQYIGRSYEYIRETWGTHIITAEDIANKNEIVPIINRSAIEGKQQGQMVKWKTEMPITNILDDIADEKNAVSNIYYLRARCRECRTLYVTAQSNLEETKNVAALGITFYKDRECTQPISNLDNYLERIYLYEIREVRKGINEKGEVVDYSPGEANFNAKKNSGYYIDANPNEFYPLTAYVIDGAANWYNDSISDDFEHEIFKRDKDLFSFVINDEENVNIEETIGYYLIDCTNLKSVVPNHGVIIEIGYSGQEKIYADELGGKSSLKKYKEAYEKTRDNWLNTRAIKGRTNFASYYYNDVSKKVEASGSYNSNSIIGVIAARYRSFYTKLTSVLTDIQLEGGAID